MNTFAVDAESLIAVAIPEQVVTSSLSPIIEIHTAGLNDLPYPCPPPRFGWHAVSHGLMPIQTGRGCISSTWRFRLITCSPRLGPTISS